MNGASSSEFYINAATNNSFTLSNVEETIKQSIYNSYGYLDQLQKNMIDLYRCHFSSSDLRTYDKKKNKVRLVVPKDLIHASMRDKYRTGKFYQKEITVKDVMKNQDSFVHVPKVYLNGVNTTKFTLKAYESLTEIYFDKTSDIMSCNDITVVFVLNDEPMRYVHTLDISSVELDENVIVKPFIIYNDDEPYKMPIPVCNILVSKYSQGSNDYHLDKSIEVARTYPFIYNISDPNITSGDKYRITYFYYPMDVSYTYTNYLKYSYDLALSITECENIPELIYQISNGEFPRFSYLLTYTPPDYEYSFSDFDNDDDHPYHFDYKIDKLGDFIKSNPRILSDYVVNQSVSNMFFEIDASSVDLSSRLRSNTYSEATVDVNRLSFSEPCYVFCIFLGTNEAYDKVFYVDGLFCDKKYSIREFDVEYAYLPVSRITSTSIIEVERLDGFVFKESFRLRSMDASKDVNIQIPTRLNSRPLMKDVFVQANGSYVNKDNFSMVKTDGELSYDLLSYTEAPVDKFKMALSDEDYAGWELTVIVDKSNTLYPTSVEMNNIFVTYVPEIFFIKKQYIRAYVNGRICRSEIIDVIYDEPSSQYILYILKPIRENSTVTVQVSPVSYARSYYKKTIPSDGIVDFSGELNKPFSSIYYDVFVNGRKLTNENILQLTPTKVKFVGLKSLKNLEIYEKDRSSNEYFGELVNFKTNYSEMKTIEESVFDGDTFTDDEKTKLINIILQDKYGKTNFNQCTDNETDNLIDEVDVESLPIAKFTLNNIFETESINPDIRQLDESVLDNGVEEDIEQWLDSDSQATSGENNVVRLNPDICFDTAIASQTISSNIGFTQKRIVDF